MSMASHLVSHSHITRTCWFLTLGMDDSFLYLAEDDVQPSFFLYIANGLLDCLALMISTTTGFIRDKCLVY